MIVKKNSELPEFVLMKNGFQMENESYRKYVKSIILDSNSATLSDFSNYRTNYKKYLRELYDVFWKPISKKLENVTRIYLSPDGVYNSISLNNLIDKNGKYVLDEIDIINVTNTKDIINSNKIDDHENSKIVLVGNPDFDSEITGVASKSDAGNSISNNHKNWAKLPWTKQEVNEISNLFKSKAMECKIFSGKNATEKNIKSIANPDILHIATHAYFNDDKQLNPNPLARCGLICAGANTISKAIERNDESELSNLSEDGILNAVEVMNMNLIGTDLVVLSACETAKGEIMSGEGVFGLQRAFQLAGAKKVIMSLWKVNDKVTKEFMVQFYKTYLSGTTIHHAFKEAQKIIKSKHELPFFWSGFVLME